MKKILALDGGGVRVYFQLLILQEIEKKTGKQIVDIFDYFAGVSASSIILSAILTKYSLSEILDLFKVKSKDMFFRSYVYMFRSGLGLFNSKYPDYFIEKALKELFDEILLYECKKPLVILTYDMKHSTPLCFSSYKNYFNYFEIWKVIRGSTSAPTYFPPFQLDNYLLVDGGMVTNNLSEMSFINAMEHFGSEKEFMELSIGTGYSLQEHNARGLIGWSSSIFDVLFRANSLYEMEILKKLSKFENLKKFYRLDFKMEKDIYLDDYNAFGKMDEIFKQWLEDNDDYLTQIANELV